MKTLTTFLLLFLLNSEMLYAAPLKKLQVYYGPSLFKYTLNSDQFEAQIPLTTGQTYAINYAYQENDSVIDHRLEWQQSNHELSVPSSLTPSTIKARLIKVNYKAVSTGEKTNFGAGYSFYKLAADETTPNIILESYESHNLDLYAERKVWHESDLAVLLFADFEIPFIKKEIGTNTGFNPSSYSLHAGYVAKYLLNDAWSILQKTEYTFDSTTFDGQGNRGTLNAKEKTDRFQFLLGAGYDF